MYNSFTIAVAMILFVFLGRTQADWSYEFEDNRVPQSWETWPHPFLNSDSETYSADATLGHLRLLEATSFAQSGTPVLRAVDTSETFADVRVSATVNLDSSVGTLMGLTTETEASGAYLFGVEFAPSADSGTAWLARAGEAAFDEWGSERDFGIPTRLEVDKSYFLELDVIGDLLTGRVFDTRGGNLLLSMTQTVVNPIVEPKYAGVYTGTPIGFEHIPTAGTFDSISATAIRPGDFDVDGILDIDAITAAIGNEPADGRHDINSDGVIDANDRTEWVKVIANTYFGDANLDGEFNSSDLTMVSQMAKYELDEDAGWADGDWTGDGRFDSSDLTTAFQDGGYELGPRADVAVVPEPSSFIVLAIGIGVIRIRSFQLW